jgi:nucleotide sugar dehydrogenase
MQREIREEEGTCGVVAVVGLGKIGLPLAVQYASRGWSVLGCDINPRVVDAINSGRTHLQEEAELETEVPLLVEQGLLSATLDTAAAVARADVVIVIVPVQIDPECQVRFEALDAATTAVGRGLRPGKVVVYETTLPVGTTEGRVRRLLEEESGLQAGRDFALAYSPERVSSGSIFLDLRVYPKVVGGLDARSLEAAVAFYRAVLHAEIRTVRSCAEAEFVKLIDTTYRDVNIALANEFACYADVHGLDVLEAITAANSQPQSHIHMPGVGVGGHCIPVYPYFLLNDERLETRTSMPGLRLLREARLINDQMAEYAVQRVESALGSLHRRSVLILGAAYRGDVREVAFSCAYRLQSALSRRGAQVYVDDPLYATEELSELGFRPLLAADEPGIEVIILQAGHRAYKSLHWQRFPRCHILLDGRCMLNRAEVEQAGIRYLTIGDGCAVEGVPSAVH